VVDVDEHWLDAEDRLNPSQRGGERERVPTAGESHHDPIVSRELCGTRVGQQALLEPARRLPARSSTRPRGRCCAPGSIAACVVSRGVHLVPTGGIEPPAKGL
jgi:hypothetical protein